MTNQTPHLPLPSTQVAHKLERTPRMRFLYPLAAACVAAVMLTPSSGEAQPGGIKLRPDQQRLVEITLQEMDPAMRPLMRDQISRNYASLTEFQTAKMIEALAANGSAAAAAPADEPVAEAEGALSPEDFEHNRAQFEPAIRKHWQAKKDFDTLVNTRLEQYCPKRDAVARWGSAWRFELIPLMQESAVASWNADIDVQVLGSTYAPQDGRYRFDFSKVRTTFDEKAVDAAVKKACDAYAKLGAQFLAKLDPMIARDDWEAAHRHEQASMGTVDPVREKLKTELDRLSPEHGYPMIAALQNARKVK